MKAALIVALTASFTTCCLLLAQTGSTTPANQNAVTADATQVSQATKAMQEVASAYKSAKAITDTIKIDMTTPMGAESQEVSLVLGSNNDAIFIVPGIEIIAVDGKLHFVGDEFPQKYFATPLQGDLRSTLQQLFGPAFPLPAHFVLRADGSLNDQVSALGLGMLGEAQLTGYRQTEKDGKAFQVVEFASQHGRGEAHIDHTSKLIQLVEVKMQAGPGMEVTARITMNPKTFDELPQPIQFVAGDRRQVESLEDLHSIGKGDEAPDFTLATLLGESVALKDLRGKYVVLDFWATWCGPCKRGLPLLSEFAEWAVKESPNVKVYAVNVWERVETSEDRKRVVAEFWNRQNFKMPTLMDLDDKVIAQYRYSGIPATVVIGPDGKVVSVHRGFSMNMIEMLKKDVGVESAGG